MCGVYEQPQHQEAEVVECHRFGVTLGYMARAFMKKKVTEIFNTTLKITMKGFNCLEGS